MKKERHDGTLWRHIPLRTRKDLTIVPIWFGEERWYVVKDPLSLQYCRLRADEYALLEQLSAPTSLHDLQTAHQHRFPDRRVTIIQLQQLLDRFQRLNLVVVELREYGKQLRKMASQQTRRRWISSLSNWLFVRLPGVDPEPLLRRIEPWFGWLFAPWMIALVVAIGGATIAIGLAAPEAIVRRLPELNQFFSVHSVGTLMLVIGATKVLHELGHALACKHFGGECHQIGPMLMVFTPALYCDTSDSWLLPNKWQRMFVGLAGVYVELLLAIGAMWLWWNTESGWVNYVSIRVALVCSVSTILINANPLLRYDGYFVLSDWWGVPNLAERARDSFYDTWRRWLLRDATESPREAIARRRLAFNIYTVASTSYRIILCLGIVTMLATWLHPYGLDGLVAATALSVGVSMLATPVMKLIQAGSAPGWTRQLHLARCVLLVVIASLLMLFVVLVPMPHDVVATGLLVPRDLQDVYVTVPGRIQAIRVQPGDHVEAGEELVELVSPDLQLEYEHATADRDLQSVQVQDFMSRRMKDEHAAEQLPSAQAMLDDLQTRVEQKRASLDALQITAPRAGMIVSPLRRLTTFDETQLEAWSELPLDAKNEGAYLAAGTVVCSVGTANDWDAQVLVDEAGRAAVRAGQPVRLLCDALPLVALRGTVQSVALHPVDRLSDRMVAARVAAVDPNDRQQTRPLAPTYEIGIRLDAVDATLVHGARIQARIQVPRQSLGRRFADYLFRTFRFL